MKPHNWVFGGDIVGENSDDSNTEKATVRGFPQANVVACPPLDLIQEAAVVKRWAVRGLQKADECKGFNDDV